MAKYIKYKRISKVVNSTSLQELFDDLSKDWEIIYYNERILDSGVTDDPLRKTDGTERILVVMVCGKINEGKEIL